MGLGSLAGLENGTGKVTSPNVKPVAKDYTALLKAYLGGQGQTFENEQTFRPQYLGLTDSMLPSATAAVGNANPAQSNLLQMLNQSASEGLQAGANLDPGLKQLTEQSVRGSQAARGLGYGPGDAFEETSAMAQLGNLLRQQRQQFAGNVAGMNNQFTNMPALQMLLNGGSDPSLTPPGSTMGLLLAPYQARLQAKMATAANNTSLTQSWDSNATKFGSSAMGAFG